MLPRTKRCGLLLIAWFVLSMAPVWPLGAEPVRFAAGALGQVQPGQSYVYSMRILMRGPDGYGLDEMPVMVPGRLEPPDPYEMRYFRVVVLDVVRAGDATRAKARLDRLDAQGKVMNVGVYDLLLASEGEKTRLVGKVGSSGVSADIRGTIWELPWVFAGVPPLTTTQLGSPTVAVQVLKSATPTRYTAQVEPGSGLVSAAVDYYRVARSDDPAEGRKIEYWAKDKGVILATVPMGQEASPMLEPGGYWPRDKYGAPERSNLRPITIDQKETQTWEPGAAFPSKITRSTVKGVVRFDATLVKVEQVPLGPSPAEVPSEAPAAK